MVPNALKRYAWQQHSHVVLVVFATMLQLYKASEAVRKNRVAAGIDKQSIKMLEPNLVENLEGLECELKSGTDEPIPLRRIYIPMGGGKCRPSVSLLSAAG